jgi:hypothetical protein
MYGNSELQRLEFPRLRPLCRPRPWRGLLFVGFAYLVVSGKARQQRRAAQNTAEKFDSCRVRRLGRLVLLLWCQLLSLSSALSHEEL